MIEGTVDLHVTDRIAYCDYQKADSWTARGVSDPNGFVGVLIDDDELWDGVETLEDVKGLYDCIDGALDEVNDYKTQVAHRSSHVEKVIKNTPGLATFEFMKAMVEDMLSAISSYEGDRYKRDFRIVRCPEDGYAIVDLESYDYSTEDVAIIGGLGYHDSCLAGDEEEDEEDEEDAA